MREKLQLVFMKNELIAYEMKLIGSCIKSDHFKDFYNAKSYIQLEREVSIKAQGVKEEIKQKTKLLEEAEKKFWYLKRRESEAYLRYSSEKEKEGKSNSNFCLDTLGLNTNWPNMSSLQHTRDNLKNTDSKFKKISLMRPPESVDQLFELRKLINYLNEHMYSLWDNYVLFDERTVAHCIELE
jgi:hypothetical protein